MLIICAVYFVIILVFADYQAVKYIHGSKKHHIRFMNIVLIAVIAVCVLLIFVDQAAIDSKRSKYKVTNGTWMSSLEYDTQDSDYYTFTFTDLFNTSHIAVKKSDAKLPLISKRYKNVAIYQSSDAKTDLDTVEVNGDYYELYDKVVKIVPDYAELLVPFIIITPFVLVFFDIVFFMAYLYNKKRRRNDTYANEEKTQS